MAALNAHSLQPKATAQTHMVKRVRQVTRLTTIFAVTIAIMWLAINKSKDMNDSVNCRRNLIQLQRGLQQYAEENAMSADQVFKKAGKLMHDHDFLEKTAKFNARVTGFGWRYSRDNHTPTCPASAPSEIYSYDGRLDAPDKSYSPYPIIWDKAPYHRGKKHRVILSNGSVDLVTEVEFSAMTNSANVRKDMHY